MTTNLVCINSERKGKVSLKMDFRRGHPKSNMLRRWIYANQSTIGVLDLRFNYGLELKENMKNENKKGKSKNNIFEKIQAKLFCKNIKNSIFFGIYLIKLYVKRSHTDNASIYISFKFLNIILLSLTKLQPQYPLLILLYFRWQNSFDIG